MQIRCNFCHKPFALGKAAVLEALNELARKKLHHYNVVCPHCGRTNRISQKELQRAALLRRIADTPSTDPETGV